MSAPTNEADNEVECSIYRELEEFERCLATARKRTRDADYLDRKLVISDSTEFERHFDNLSEAIARLLPYHTFYVDEIKSNRVHEDQSQISERMRRIKSIEESIMSISTGNPSLIFNACKYGFVRVTHSSILMELERNKKELAQLQALELAWKYPMEGNPSFPMEKTLMTTPSAINTPSHLGTSHLEHSNELLYRNVVPKTHFNSQSSNSIGNYGMNKHYYESADILARDKEKDMLPSNSQISQSPNLDNAYLAKMNGTTAKNMDIYSMQPDILNNERFPSMNSN
ncbi:synaptobrevin'synaptobrevin [Cryptosporidium canis]|uniref:Synaptobrevin'synaptobrevin n=1 Tax=Cryptosporidium canis TaxID=195482 RepID=A0A9D5HWE9_9CRYT|nr:synaptobrevin'synaptobrevin [Cryptosporidium canis]